MNNVTFSMTPHKTLRVFFPAILIDMLGASKMATVITVLNAFSIWGGYDSKNANYTSWEFPSDFEPHVRRALSNLNVPV